MRSLQLALIGFYLLCSLCFAQEVKEDNESQLTLERIYSGSEFSSKGFGGRWLDEGHYYAKTEDSKTLEGTRDIVRYDALTEEQKVLVPGSLLIPDAESKPLSVDSYSFSKDRSLMLIYTNSKRVWRTRSRGDYWILDRSSRKLHQIASFAKPSTTQFAKISPDSSKVAYVVDGNIYVEDTRGGAATKLTQKASDNIINGTFDWVYEEEFQVRDGFRWSPDSKRIAYWQLDTTGVPVFTMINNTDSMYPKLIQFAHPKTGQRNSACRVGVVDANLNEQSPRTWWVPVEGDPRENYIARMEWTSDPNELVLQQFNRLQNTNNVMIMGLYQQGPQTILTERDEAWVDAHRDMHWLKDGAEFTWPSERDGWRHLYVVSRNGQETRLITPGQFDVMSLQHIDEKRGVAYFMASPENATQRYLFKAQLDGSGVERVTPRDLVGSSSYQISHDGTLAIHTHSRSGVAPTTNLVSLPDHKVVRTIQENEKLKEKLDKLDSQPVEFLKIDIGDDVVFDAWCIKPPNIEQGKKYPLLVYVYGEPAGSTVADRWGGNSYLWHLMLAQKGYVVMSIDNRGTNVARGREWRKSIYRKIGIIASEDQSAAIKKVLSERPYIDEKRIGVWGWSGGGSMALNGIFRYPDLYKAAISIAPVPNQRYYDTIYQERYMGLPSDNVDGYRDGSPINFAHQLKGNLLLIHGTGDDNCHYQTMEMLINELIRHNKQFSMMAYPNRSHSIREGKNTTRHLRQLMTNFLLENL